MINSQPRSLKSAHSLRCAGLFGLAFVLCTLVGCTDSTPQRMSVSGTVTLNAKPVGNATIILTPIGNGLAAAAVIENGKFATTKEDGPTVGEFHVRINPMEAEIEAINPDERSRANRNPSIPKIYQQDGKLRATITAKPNQRIDLHL